MSLLNSVSTDDSNSNSNPARTSMPSTPAAAAKDEDLDDFSFWDDDESDVHGSTTTNRKRTSQISARMPSVKELTAKIIKLERENFQLKLRVHLNGTRGTAEPITAAAPKKSQREFQVEKDVQELRLEKDRLALRLQQQKEELEQETKLKDQLIEREAQFLAKYAQLKKYVDFLEKEKIKAKEVAKNLSSPSATGRSPYLKFIEASNATSSQGQGQGQGQGRGLSVITVSRAVGDSLPLPPPLNTSTSPAIFQGLSAEEWNKKYEKTLRNLQVTSKELKQSQKECESVTSDRVLLLKQLKTSEAIRKRESIAMESRLKENLEKLSKENKDLRLTNEGLKADLAKAAENAEVSKKMAVQEISSQLFYHQTALEKVHEEQALLIAELQSLKKSCPIRSPAAASTAIALEFCKKVDHDLKMDLEPESQSAKLHPSVTATGIEMVPLALVNTMEKLHATISPFKSGSGTSGTTSPRFLRKPGLLNDSTAEPSLSDFQLQVQKQSKQTKQKQYECLKNLNYKELDLELQQQPLQQNNNNGNATYSLNTTANETSIASVNRKLHEKNSKLAMKLQNTRESLKQAIALLEYSEKDKEGMEKIICRQLHRTHIILADVKDTLIHSNNNSSSNSNSNSNSFPTETGNGPNSPNQNQPNLAKQNQQRTYQQQQLSFVLNPPKLNSGHSTPRSSRLQGHATTTNEFRTKHKPFTI